MKNECLIDELMPETENAYEKRVSRNARVATAVNDYVYIVMRKVVSFDWVGGVGMIDKIFRSHSKAVDYLTRLGCTASTDKASGKLMWTLELIDGVRSVYTIERHDVY